VWDNDGFCNSSRPVKVYEQEVGIVMGLYYYWTLLHTG
jgi:hypothetical protein